MIKLNPFAISGLFVAATYLPLFLFIFTKGQTKLSKIFSLYMFAVFVWGVGSFIIGAVPDKNIAILTWKISYIAVLTMPPFFLHSVMLMTNEKNRLLTLTAYGVSGFFIASIFMDKIMNDVVWMFNSFYCPVGTTTYLYSFLFWSAFFILGHVKLLLYYKRSLPQERSQFLTLIVSDIKFLAAITNFLPGLGIAIYPFGNFIIPIHSIVISNAILRHQLLGINLVFNRSMVYSLLIFVLSSLYLVLVIILEKLLQSFFSYNSAAIRHPGRLCHRADLFPPAIQDPDHGGPADLS